MLVTAARVASSLAAGQASKPASNREAFFADQYRVAAMQTRTVSLQEQLEIDKVAEADNAGNRCCDTQSPDQALNVQDNNTLATNGWNNGLARL